MLCERGSKEVFLIIGMRFKPWFLGFREQSISLLRLWVWLSLPIKSDGKNIINQKKNDLKRKSLL